MKFDLTPCRKRPKTKSVLPSIVGNCQMGGKKEHSLVCKKKRQFFLGSLMHILRDNTAYYTIFHGGGGDIPLPPHTLRLWTAASKEVFTLVNIIPTKDFLIVRSLSTHLMSANSELCIIIVYELLVGRYDQTSLNKLLLRAGLGSR